MANFGIGLGAFADGFARGMGLRERIDARNADKAKKKAFEQAKTDYDAAIADNVLTQAGQANADGSAPAFDAGKASGEARKKMSFTDYLYQTALPKIIDTYVAQGDLEGAERLRVWGQDAKERKFMDGFGRALNSFAAGQADGNYTPFADQTVKLLNEGGYGVKATGYDMVKDGDGNQTGITFHLEDGDRKYSHTFNSMQEAGEFIAGQGDPRSRVQLFQQQAASADKFKAEMAKEQAKAQIGLSRDVQMEGVRQQGRMDLEDQRHQNRLQIEAAKTKQTGSKTQQEFEYMQGLMKSNGFSDEEIRAYIPAMLKIGNYRKGRSTEEYAQQIVLELTKDPMMARKPPEEIAARARQLVEMAQAVASEQQQQKQPAPSAQPGLGAQQPPLNVFR